MAALLERMSWTGVRDALARGVDAALVPLGATEHNGHHLALPTDTVNAMECARRAAEVGGKALLAPAVPFGVSDNHMDFPGTITVRQETLIALIEDIARSLLRHGFHRVYLLVGHGGDLASANAAAERLRIAQRDALIGVIYTPSPSPKGKEVMESQIEWHADESETSVTLALNPWAVDMAMAVDEMPRRSPYPIEFKEAALTESVVGYGIPRTKDLSDSRSIGEPSLATEAKGRAVAEDAVRTLARILGEGG